MIIRKIKSDEEYFLREMLYQAIFIPPGKPPLPRSITGQPELARYIKDWGKGAFDLAYVAEHNGMLIGAIWGRQFVLPKVGYGYVDGFTPEISMAIKEAHRGRGIGAALLENISASYNERGVSAISLSVDKLNPAFKFYQKNGFEYHEETGTAITMIKWLSKGNATSR